MGGEYDPRIWTALRIAAVVGDSNLPCAAARFWDTGQLLIEVLFISASASRRDCRRFILFLVLVFRSRQTTLCCRSFRPLVVCVSVLRFRRRYNETEWAWTYLN